MAVEKYSRLQRSLWISLKWIFLFLYVVFPVGVLLLFRGPEIASTLQVDHHLSLAKGGLVITLFLTWRYRWNGFVLCLAIGIGAFKYSMDVNLCWRPDANISLTKRVAVVTGANSGLGLATAKSLAALGAHVILTCRSVERCKNAVDQVNASGKAAGGSASSAVLNLGSLQSTYDLTMKLTSEYPSIHYLFNNAGSTPQYNLTQEGFEDGFGGMHLAHAAVTLGLIPSLRRAGEMSGSPARIIMTSSDIGITSACGFFGSETFEHDFMHGTGEGDLRGECIRGDGTTWNSLSAYGRAKLCNILFASEINRRFSLHQWPILAHSLHTGAVSTYSASNGVGGIFRGIPGLPYVAARILAPLLWRSSEQGARVLLFAALSTEPESMTRGGQYIDAVCRPTPSLETANSSTFEKRTVELPGNRTLNLYEGRWEALKAANDKWAARLWDVSLHLLESSPAKDVVKFAP